jgi:hypothetical protein
MKPTLRQGTALPCFEGPLAALLLLEDGTRRGNERAKPTQATIGRDGVPISQRALWPQAMTPDARGASQLIQNPLGRKNGVGQTSYPGRTGTCRFNRRRLGNWASGKLAASLFDPATQDPSAR